MSESAMAGFLHYLVDHPEEKLRVLDLERSLATAFREGQDAIAAIAAEAGFDITGWVRRPGVVEPATSHSVCCGILTWPTDDQAKTP